MEVTGFAQFIREQQMEDCVAEQLQILIAETTHTTADISLLTKNDLAQTLTQALTALQRYKIVKEDNSNLAFFSNPHMVRNASIAHKHTFLSVQKLSLFRYPGDCFTKSDDLLKARKRIYHCGPY